MFGMPIRIQFRFPNKFGTTLLNLAANPRSILLHRATRRRRAFFWISPFFLRANLSPKHLTFPSFLRLSIFSLLNSAMTVAAVFARRGVGLGVASAKALGRAQGFNSFLR